MKTAILHTFALATFVLTRTRSWCANSPIARVQLRAEVDRLRTEVGLLREEIRIKDARMARIPPARRPHYAPIDRLAILELRAARAWSLAQTARVFLLADVTIASWTRRLDEDGEDALVKMPT